MSNLRNAIVSFLLLCIVLTSSDQMPVAIFSASKRELTGQLVDRCHCCADLDNTMLAKTATFTRFSVEPETEKRTKNVDTKRATLAKGASQNQDKSAVVCGLTNRAVKVLSSGESNIRKLRAAWLDYLNGRDFHKRSKDAFEDYSRLNSTISKGRAASELPPDLNLYELEVVIEQLTQQLDDMVGGRLPPPAEGKAVEQLLQEFDADGSGTLDKEEFLRFCRVYFARLEWPIWSEALRGFRIGVTAAVLLSWPIGPYVIEPCINIIKPFAIAKVKTTLHNLVAEQAAKFNLMMQSRLKDGNPLTGSELAELAKRRYARNQALRNFRSIVTTFGIAGAGAGAVGLLPS